MPFIKRDHDGQVAAVFLQPEEDALEEVALASPEVLAFLNKSGQGGQPLGSLLQSDMEMARVVEDLVEVLLSKNIIEIDDLPEAALAKLRRRQDWRGDLEAALAVFGGGKVI